MKNIAWPNPSIFKTARVQQHTARVFTDSELMPPPPPRPSTSMLPPPRPSACTNHIFEQRNTESPSSASDNNTLSNVRNAPPSIVPAVEMPQSNINDDFNAGFRRDSKPFSVFEYEVNHSSGLRAILDERRRVAGYPPATIPGERGISILGNPFGNMGMTQMPVPPGVLSNAGPSSSASSSMPAIRDNAATVPSETDHTEM